MLLQGSPSQDESIRLVGCFNWGGVIAGCLKGPGKGHIINESVVLTVLTGIYVL